MGDGESLTLSSTGSVDHLSNVQALQFADFTVIVAQTLYASTKDHLPEFATLRAIGCSNRYIYSVIRYQALLNAVIGFCVAGAIGAVVVQMTAKSALPIVITPALVIGVFVLTIVMCTLSAILAIVRVVRIDPVMVLAR